MIAMRMGQAGWAEFDKVLRVVLVVGAGCLAVSTGFALVAAHRWPLVGDEGLIHYVVFLMQAGRRPYSGIVDVNWPGSYLLDAFYMRVLGSGAYGLRLYDGVLCALVCAGMALLSERGWKKRVVGLMGGLLLTLVHLRDGVVQAGQRDLAMAVLVLLAYAAMLRGPLRGRYSGVLAFQFLAGCSLMIKPTLFPILVVPLFLIREEETGWRRSIYRWLGSLCVAGVPLLCMMLWLAREDAVRSFISLLETTELVHKALSHQGSLLLLLHLLSPLAGVLLVALVAGLRWPERASSEIPFLLLGVVAGAISFFAQGKGLPYHRYPFLVLALTVACRTLAGLLERVDEGRLVAALTLSYLCFWVGPVYARQVVSYDAREPFEAALEHDLKSVGAVRDGVQCLDTVGGCIDTLYEMRLVQATGYLYDCYAYAGTTGERVAYQRKFLEAMERVRPGLVVLTSRMCLTYADDMNRVSAWPELDAVLSTEYRRQAVWSSKVPVHWWSHSEVPAEYVLYRRK